MKCALILLALAAAASAVSMPEFRAWCRENDKFYTAAETLRRFAIFRENAAISERLNIENPETTFGLNKFSDLTNDEFAAIYAHGLIETQQADLELPDLSAEDVNEEVDYSHYLPAVKDQGQCGSCWAFGAVANMEGQTYMNNGHKVVSMSEQELVSCDKGFNMGCDGGNCYMADLYAIANGMATEASYPYTSGTGKTGTCKSYKATYKFSNAEQWNSVTDSQMMKYLKEYGPLSVGVEADKSVFQNYVSGVLDSSACGTSVNHAVTLVGYGTDSATGKNYWHVRNSWGSSWGAKGYIKLVRSKNMCGINTQPSTIIY